MYYVTVNQKCLNTYVINMLQALRITLHIHRYNTDMQELHCV